MSLDSIDLARRAADSLVVVRQYAASDAVRSVIRLLIDLEAQYKADLENVTVENLIPLQTAIKQVAALRRSITAEQHLDPKIL